jgi:hypothetical protein
MDQNNLTQTIGKLPQNLREAIYAPDMFDKVEKLGKTSGLDEVQIGLLGRLTVKLMAGILAPTEFVAAIENDLGVEREKAAYIAQDINRDIFNPVKDALKEVHNVQAAPQVSAAAAKPEEPKKDEGIALWKTYQADMVKVGGAKTEEEKPGSILEQKLGGTFRMSSSRSAPAGGTIPSGLAPEQKPVVAPIQMHREVLQKPLTTPTGAGPQPPATPKVPLPASIQAQFSGVPAPKEIVPPAPQQTVPPAQSGVAQVSTSPASGLSGMLSGAKPAAQANTMQPIKPASASPSTHVARPVPKPPIGTAPAPTPVRAPAPATPPSSFLQNTKPAA